MTNSKFGKMNLNFKANQRVILGNTGSEIWDGKIGKIVGISDTTGYPSYIVLFEKPPFSDGMTAICITEVCLCGVAH